MDTKNNKSVNLTDEQVNENFDMVLESLTDFVNEGKNSLVSVDKHKELINDLLSDIKNPKSRTSDSSYKEGILMAKDLSTLDSKAGKEYTEKVENALKVRDGVNESINEGKSQHLEDWGDAEVDVADKDKSDIAKESDKISDWKFSQKWSDDNGKLAKEYETKLKAFEKKFKVKVKRDGDVNESYIITESLEVNEGKVISINKFNGKKIKKDLVDAKKLWDEANKHQESKQYSQGYAGYTMDAKDQKDSDAKFAKFDNAIAKLSKMLGQPDSTVREMSWDDEFRKRVFKGVGINESLELVNESKTDLELVNEALSFITEGFSDVKINKARDAHDGIRTPIKQDTVGGFNVSLVIEYAKVHAVTITKVGEPAVLASSSTGGSGLVKKIYKLVVTELGITKDPKEAMGNAMAKFSESRK
jgi:hypothetical protein